MASIVRDVIPDNADEIHPSIHGLGQSSVEPKEIIMHVNNMHCMYIHINNYYINIYSKLYNIYSRDYIQL